MAYLLQDVENVFSSSTTFSSIINLMKKKVMAVISKWIWRNNVAFLFFQLKGVLTSINLHWKVQS